MIAEVLQVVRGSVRLKSLAVAHPDYKKFSVQFEILQRMERLGDLNSCSVWAYSLAVGDSGLRESQITKKL